jgi:FKBP-type peptidyl-prolyl cis-trans isomerase
MARRLPLALLVLGLGLPAAKADDPEPPAKVVKTASGLKYENLKEGKGKAAKKFDKVEVHYTLWLAADKKKKVGSSADRRQPFSFTVGKGEVIKGFDEGVAGMKVGDKRKLMVPAKLGYGEKGAGKVIPPDADLVFEVELLAIK